ncbi:phytase [Endozoicomonas arenosclerae]|uniref:phytase n=1 Tax=Endozoicomonas arenosclerae TaxID=1633495 RepID=UPI000782C9C3|nr:phytase [Endozoicomonas arenosclerae]
MMIKTTIKQLSLTVSLAAMIAAITGCNSEPELQTRAIQNTEGLSGETIIPLFNESAHEGQSLWLATSENEGLLLLDDEGKVRSQIKGSNELLDIRQSVTIKGEPVLLAASVNKESNRPLLVAVDTKEGSLKTLASLPSPSFDIDGICLYRDNQEHVYLFMLNGRGAGQQWLVVDGATQQTVSREVRELALPPLSSYCSVDDSTHALYISEEEVGVWKYGAHPEAAPGRQVIQLVQPHGSSAENVAGLSAFPGGVMVVDPDTATISGYKVDGESVEEAFAFKVAGAEAPESVSVARDSDSTLRVGLFDDEADQYLAADVDWKKSDAAADGEFLTILPEVQTPPMGRFGDVADDPAIWVNPDDAHQSLVLGTNKKQGLFVYDMQGKELQSFTTGRLNNVDVRYDFSLGRKTVDVATASNRTDNSIAVYSIDRESGRLTESGKVKTDLSEIYGLCMYQPEPGRIDVFVNDKDGTYQQYRLKARGMSIAGTKVRTFKVDSQPEGCVANEATEQLFVGEEGAGVWVIGANEDDGVKLETVAKIGGALVDDVEGMAVYAQEDHSYLVVSSQGNDSYAIFDTEKPYAYRGSFRVGLNAAKGIDGASETDGLDVSSANFGGVFSEGMLVVQDGRNQMPSSPQNFKYIPWKSIQSALKLD